MDKESREIYNQVDLIQAYQKQTDRTLETIRGNIYRLESVLHVASIEMINEKKDAVSLIDTAGILLHRIECMISEYFEEDKPDLYKWIDG